MVQLKSKINAALTVTVVLLYVLFNLNEQPVTTKTISETYFSSIEKLIEEKKSGKFVIIEAEVVKILSDDVKGSQHQRMILKNEDNTVLLAHNIDIAQRIPAQVGDILEIKGQYEWNEKGGVIHWTHRDIKNKRPKGWVKLNNKTYQ